MDSLLIVQTRLLSSSNQTLSLHPFGDDAINLLWLLPKQPVRGIDILSGELRDVCTHRVSKLISDDGVAESPHEKSRALDLGAVFNRQQGSVGLPVSLAIAIVVACGLSVDGCRVQ